MSRTWRGIQGMPCLVGIAAVVLLSSVSRAAAQNSPQVVQESAKVVSEPVRVPEPLVVAELPVAAVAPGIQAAGVPVRWYAPRVQQVPQDVRIMESIVNTALSAVQPPAKPSELSGDSANGGGAGTTRGYVVAPVPTLFGRRDVSGFYMKGYGYLFTVRWPVGSNARLFRLQEAVAIDAAMASQRQALARAKEQLEQFREQSKQEAQAQASGQEQAKEAQAAAKQEMAQARDAQVEAEAEAQKELEHLRQTRAGRLKLDQARSKALTQWAAEYRQRLSDALRDAIAGYGSTLRRARPGESITFIADFGGGDSASVIMTVKAGALHGSDVTANREAIQVSNGQSGMSERMRTQLDIMSRIIDTSLSPEASDQLLTTNAWNTYFGGEARPLYVPGYGVIFRKNARLNTARTFARLGSTSWLQARGTGVDSVQLAARKVYREHLDTLRRKTAEILATYGPTLTRVQAGDWVGVYYDVGSAAALLDGGAEHYLVQARMSDIREAAAQSDPAAWLLRRLVTNGRGS